MSVVNYLLFCGAILTITGLNILPAIIKQSYVNYEPNINSHTVSAQYRHEGCYRDNSNSRALPTETATYYFSSKTYAIKLCNLAAYRKGYEVFGVQAGGECWSMANASRATANTTYNKFGSATNCKDGAGDSLKNDVYEVKGPYTNTPIGCFSDNLAQRALSQKLGDFRFSLRTEDKIDLCYIDAASRDYPVFAIGNEGKCFIGPDTSAAYKYGGSGGCRKGLGCPVFCFDVAIDVYTMKKKQFSSSGCFTENIADRAMPTALGDYQATRNADAVQLCSLDAKTNGYKKFALFLKGKCYSGADSESTYNKHGSSSSCVDGKGSSLAISVYDVKEPEVACSASWMENEGKCYKAFEAKHSRSNAEEECAYKGGYLVDIPTSSDQDFIERFLLNGENKNLKGDKFWIGAVKKNGKFEWRGGKEVKVTYWSSLTNPNAAGMDCASIQRSSGEWFAESCATEHDGYICAKRAGGGALKPNRILGICLAVVLTLFHGFFQDSAL